MYGPPWYGSPEELGYSYPDEEVETEATRLRHCEYYGDLDVPLNTEDEEVIEATEV